MNYENKKARAVGLAESIMNQCVILYNNLRSVVKVDKMCSSRLLFTLSTYLCAVTSTNPEFFEKHRKPMNMWKINDRRH